MGSIDDLGAFRNESGFYYQRCSQQCTKGPYGDAPARFTRNPAAIKDPQDAEDLNDMLMWVTLAKRPLSLDELDAMLRLKYLDGEGVLNLEGKLLIQFANVFTLTREDTLTTADLQAQRKSTQEKRMKTL